MNTAIDWIAAGQEFGLDDLVFWQGKGHAPFSAVAARIDTIVLGPHASARFPAELPPFVDAALTRRKLPGTGHYKDAQRQQLLPARYRPRVAHWGLRARDRRMRARRRR